MLTNQGYTGRADLAILLRLIDEMTPELDKATRGAQKKLDEKKEKPQC